MNNDSNKKSKKKYNPRHFKLQKAIGNSLRALRKRAGYGNSNLFAYANEINRGQYGKYEAGSVNMRITTLLDIAIAHGLTEEQVFNKDFLALGQTDSENALTEKSDNHLINQVRNQVKLVSNETKTNSYDDDDIKDLHKLLVTGWSPSSKRQLFKKIGLNSKTPRFENLLDFLEEVGWITMTDPDSPNSPKQKYYTTEKGKKVLRLAGE